MNTDPGVESDPTQPPASASTGVAKPAPAAQGADPADVRVDIGASDGAVPSSYGAGGGLEDDAGR